MSAGEDAGTFAQSDPAQTSPFDHDLISRLRAEVERLTGENERLREEAEDGDRARFLASAGEVSDAAVEVFARILCLAANGDPDDAFEAPYTPAWHDLVDEARLVIGSALRQDFGPLLAALPHLSPRPDAEVVAAVEVERPWFVQVESTLFNGEDDVMSPEPGEVVWASSADEAGDLIEPRDYDTNLIAVRPATRDETLAEVNERAEGMRLNEAYAVRKVNEALAALAAVRALADEWRKYHDDSAPNAYTIIYGDAANMLHRALATPAPAPVDDRKALAEWSESDRNDVSAWLTSEADQRVKFFPQRRDGVDSLLRHLAGYVKGGQA